MNKKRLIYVVIGIISAILAMFLILSLSLSDTNINGITGTIGIFKLIFTGESGIKLTDEPMQYMVRSGNERENNHLELFLKEFTNEYSIKTHYTGTAVIDNVKYDYQCRSFTNMYWIVTFE